MKTPINPLNVFMYIAVGALALGFLLAAVPAIQGNAALTKSLGLAGMGIGALAGVGVGFTRRFR